MSTRLNITSSCQASEHDEVAACRWVFRHLYETEVEAALGYDEAVRRLAPNQASSYCNFPEGGSTAANGMMACGGDRPAVRQHLGGRIEAMGFMELNPQSPWDAEDGQVPFCCLFLCGLLLDRRTCAIAPLVMCASCQRSNIVAVGAPLTV
jgi:hypothetical protein